MKKIKALLLISVLACIMLTATGCGLSAIMEILPLDKESSIDNNNIDQQTPTLLQGRYPGYNRNGTNGTGGQSMQNGQNMTNGQNQNMLNGQNQSFTGGQNQSMMNNSMVNQPLSAEDMRMVRLYLRNANNNTYNLNDDQRQFLSSQNDILRANKQNMRSANDSDRQMYSNNINGAYSSILNSAKEYYKMNNIDYDNLYRTTNGIQNQSNMNTNQTNMNMQNNNGISNQVQAQNIPFNSTNTNNMTTSQTPGTSTNNSINTNTMANSPNVSGANSQMPVNIG